MNNRNRYENLRIDCLADVDPVAVQHSLTLTDSRDEQITINTSCLPDGLWVYGYLVYWHNGRVSTSNPSAGNGLFRSQREAQLHAVGFMQLYLRFFTEQTREALHRAENKLIQTSLF